MSDDNHNGDLAKIVGQVKAKCRITWVDSGTESIVAEGIVPSALSVIRFMVGIPDSVDFDFSEPGIEHALLLNYCYYAWHDAEDDFGKNYAADLAFARRKWEVLNDAEQQEGTS